MYEFIYCVVRQLMGLVLLNISGKITKRHFLTRDDITLQLYWIPIEGVIDVCICT